MKITEIISEDRLDEGWKDALAKGVGGIAQGIGAVAGGAMGAIDRVKKGYAAGRAAVAGTPQANATSAAQTSQDTTSQSDLAAPPQTSAPTTQPAQAQASSTELQDLKNIIAKLSPEQKKQISTELQKSPTTPPQKPAGAQQTPQQGLTSGQIDQQQAVQQMKQTQQANLATSRERNQLQAAVKAAKAKPGFQQTAQDKLTIKQGAEKGIHESLNIEPIVGFESKFLGKII